MKLKLLIITVLLVVGCSRDPADSCNHRWGKWKSVPVYNLASGLHDGQERECETCGAKQLRSIKSR